MIRLQARDGHELDAYLAEPKGTPRGGLVVVQEIFGVTDHIKRVADQYAAEGYRAIAPATFDRIKRGITLPYTDVEQGRAYMQQLEWPNTLADVEAAADAVRGAEAAAIVGFCWGGTVAHVAASELDFDAAISYYGGGVAPHARQAAAVSDRLSLRRSGSRDPDGRRPENHEARTRTPRSTSTRARAMASIATSARAIARRTRAWHSAARSNFSKRRRPEEPQRRGLLRLKIALGVRFASHARAQARSAMR